MIAGGKQDHKYRPSGTVVLQPIGTMTRGTLHRMLTMVSDLGREQQVGLAGQIVITFGDGRPASDCEDTLTRQQLLPCYSRSGNVLGLAAATSATAAST